jgi:hypothetical protein
MHALLVAKDIFQFAEIFHYNATCLILFADDTVLFGKTPEILQHLLDKLFIYCRKWNIEVNTDSSVEI